MFRITAALRSVCDITPTMLQHFGIRGLLLDLDNTLTTHDNPRPAEGVLDWIAVMKENGIAMCIVSNNHPPRVKPFADLLGLPFVCEGKKPLSKGFREARTVIGLPWKELAVVGDQIFTDVLGANLKRLKCIFVLHTSKLGFSGSNGEWKYHSFPVKFIKKRKEHNHEKCTGYPWAKPEFVGRT